MERLAWVGNVANARKIERRSENFAELKCLIYGERGSCPFLFCENQNK